MNNSKTYWKKEADRLFSLWIRQRDSIDGVCRCITCGTPHQWRYLDCGHFMLRQHEVTRYHEMNCNAQCKACNNKDWNQGKQYEHGLFIDMKNGEGTAQYLLTLSKMTCKRNWLDYKIIADEFKQKLKDNNFEIR